MIDGASTVDDRESRLHIGGMEPRAGWKILNIQPGEGVDYIGDIRDLGQFPDGAFDVIYGSHVLEHVSQVDIVTTLLGLNRIPSADGRLMISVPDLEVLANLFVRADLDKAARFSLNVIAHKNTPPAG